VYRPEVPPQDPTLIPEYLERELNRIAAQFDGGESSLIYLSVNNTLPDKPREGDVRNFAATVATASAGLHEYVGGAWSKL